MSPDPSDHEVGPKHDHALVIAAARSVPICWPMLDDASADIELAALDRWVRWLTTRYTLAPRTIPPCWSDHDALIEELSALRTAWLAAFAPTARGVAPIDWHVQFWAARNRLEQTMRYAGCTKDDHYDDQPAAWLSARD